MSEPSDVLRANRRRRLARRVGLIVITPLLIAVLALCLKVLSMYAFAFQAASTYAAGDYAGTTQAARGQEFLNFFEPYKAPFNVGVGLAGAGDLAGARAKFEESLGLARGLEQCAVRVNLAIVIERIGDQFAAEGDRGSARAEWQDALLVLLEAPEGCRTPEADEVSPDPDQSMPETVTEEERRIREKLQEGGGQGETTPPEDPETEEPETVGEDELEDIQDQLEEGTDERDEFLEGEQDGYGSGTDRPW